MKRRYCALISDISLEMRRGTEDNHEKYCQNNRTPGVNPGLSEYEAHMLTFEPDIWGNVIHSLFAY